MNKCINTELQRIQRVEAKLRERTLGTKLVDIEQLIEVDRQDYAPPMQEMLESDC